MRYHYLRFDIWACLGLSFLISFVPAKITQTIFTNKYKSYVEEHTVSAGEIGGMADSSIYQAQSVEDLLAHDTFTIVSPGIEYRNKGGGYHNNHYMQTVTLPSGEKIAALINEENVKHMGDSIYSGDSILPLGKIVYEDLTKDETFLHQIEYKEKLTRTDFYVDMLGNGGKLSQIDYVEAPSTMIQILTIILLFPLLHMVGAKIGIFPYFFAPKNQKKSEWK